MPLHDLTYKTWKGQVRGTPRFAPIFRESFLYGWRTKWLKLLYALAWGPCVVGCIFMFVVYQVLAPAGRGDAAHSINRINLEFHFKYQLAQFFVMVVMASMIGPGLIAEDRRANALEIYLSRPITRIDYLLGKILALSAFLFSVTFLPQFVLWFMDWMMSTDPERLSVIWDYPFRSLAFNTLLCFGTSLFVLAISSLSRSTTMGIIYWVVCFFASLMIGQALAEISSNRFLGLFSYFNLYYSIARALYEMSPAMRTPHWSSCLIMIFALSCVSIFVLMRRLRGSEVFR